MKKIFKFSFAILLAIVTVLGINVASAKAADFTPLKYKTVNNYNELLEHIESESYIYYKIGKTEEEEYTYSVDITEPGWFIICDYRYYWSTVESYLYTNKMMTTAVDKKNFSDGLSGKLFTSRVFQCFYVVPGTYYYDMVVNQHDNSMVYAAFMPLDKLCAVDKIEYNDDFTEAVVTFKTVPAAEYSVNWSNQSNKLIDAWNTGYWQNWEVFDKFVTKPEYNLAYQMMNDGWKITENGDYSLKFQTMNNEYKDFPAVVNFTIDKIGTTIEPKTVKLNKTKATIKVGATLALKGTIKPANATLTGLKWKSSNTKVATVDKNGKVTAKKKGTCVITVTTENDKKAKCKITVK